MPRTRRLHLPNAGFHITARTQNGAQLFTPDIRTSIAADIEDAIPTFGHILLAHVVMPNHLHIVLKQGDAPLGWVMQRIMQRAVAHVRRLHGGEGHVFGRPYWSCTCANPAYLRRAIVYTHLNPVKAGLCDAVGRYPWSTHHHYMTDNSKTSGKKRVFSEEGLMLFTDTSVGISDARTNYMRFIDFCMFQRANRIPGDWLLPEGPNRISMPSAAHGDTYWKSNYSSFAETNSFTRVNVDVARPATRLLNRIDPDLTLDYIRALGRSHTLSPIRRQLIEGLLVHGCRTTAISRCLQVSASVVSKVAANMRASAARQQ